jgi:gamma-glutamylputrescine oxidase
VGGATLTAPPGYTDTYYSRTITAPREWPGLDGTVDAEICVIGGGLAGTATALGLAEAGRDVVLIERHRIGWGASGRNGGFASPGLPGGMAPVAERVGVPVARDMYQMPLSAGRLMKQRVAQYGIDCGPLVQGGIRCGMAGSRTDVRDYVDQMNRDYDAGLEHWPADRVRGALSTTRYGDGFFNPHSFAIHPLNFARGMAAATSRLGGRIYEATPATRLALKGAVKTVTTAQGQVRAEHVVLAGGGHIGGLFAPLTRATIPIATFVVTTEMLGSRLEAAIRVPYTISDIQVPTNYYRKLADGRLLWGGRVFGWQRSPAAIARDLQRDIAAFYPDLADAKIEAAWAGLMPYLRHKMPSFGALSPGVWYATGFGGLGVVLTTLAGQLVSAGISAGDDRWRMFAQFGLPFGGGQLGRIPAQMTYWRHQLESKLGRHTHY